MGYLVRFPQERCRWPAPSDQHEPSAVIIVLPVIRIERQNVIDAKAVWLRDYDPETTVWPPTFWC